MNDQEVKDHILRVVGTFLDLNRFYVFLFGSRAAGRNSPRADWDIGILGQEAVPGHRMAEIRGELEDSRIVYMIDVVDFQGVADAFRKAALSRIDIWNRPKIKPALL